MSRHLNLPLILVMAVICVLVVECLSGCAGLRPFPTKSLYEFDPKGPVCAEYRITDPVTLKFAWVRDIPFAQCPAVFGFLASDIPKVLQWGRDSITYGRTHCQ